jgi:pSer/pThr/pTyr-binding forkhead associated (FHA) protein
MAIRLTARNTEDSPNSQPFFERTFRDYRITIGNDPLASLCLNGSVGSAEHVVIVEEGNQSVVINQAEGTVLNGEPLDLNVRRTLKNGDLLSIGTYEITVSIEPNELQDNAVATRVGEQRPQPTKSFAAILDGLRTDEDRFYFLVEGGRDAGLRVPIELEQMPVGWTGSGHDLSFNIASIVDLCGIIRKEWSGIVLQPQIANSIFVNGEPLVNERRLKDGDRVLLAVKETGNQYGINLVFHEPTSLIILDSLMPRAESAQGNGVVAETPTEAAAARLEVHKPTEKLAALIKSDKEYFSVFTFVELLLMVVGTIIGAVIIFLILNYS